MERLLGRFSNRALHTSISVLLIASVALASCGKQARAPQTSQPVAPKVIWSGVSSGYAIRWTTGDITAAPARAPGRPSFSELGRAIVHFSAITREQTSNCDFQREVRLQSVVGSIISVRESDSTHCDNGVTGTGLATAAINLARPQAAAMLSDIFPAHALAAAQMKAGQLCKSVPKDLLSRFAFGELHGNTVVVLLTLSPGCSSTDINLALTAPPALKQQLRLAAQEKAGFLWHDQAAISHGDVTAISYHYRTSTLP